MSTELEGRLTRSTVYDGPNVHLGLGRDGEKNIIEMIRAWSRKESTTMLFKLMMLP
jgi:hypothetical protein